MTTNVSRETGSGTAELVAAVRAGHLLQDPAPHILSDPFAVHFGGPFWGRVARSRFLYWLVSKRLLGRFRPVSRWVLGRARFAEDALQEAVERGIGQYLLLGSGYDSVALRRPDLEATIFEVDLAATHAKKRKRLQAAGLEMPDNVRSVEIDFERDELAGKLAEHGFRAEQPSFVNWMGVTYYLTREAVESTIRQLERLTAPGSEFAFDYLMTGESLAPENRRLATDAVHFVAKRGEPFITDFHPGSILAELALGEGWEELAHPSATDLRERYQPDPAEVWAPLFRLLLLRRRGG